VDVKRIPSVADVHPRGLTLVGVLLVFGACMATLAGTTLTWPGSSLDRIWELNRYAFKHLSPHGKAAGIPFLLFAGILAAISAGWFTRRLWAWRFAVVIIATQILGDLLNIGLGRLLEGTIGVAIASAILFYLLRPPVRAAFSSHGASR